MFLTAFDWYSDGVPWLSITELPREENLKVLSFSECILTRRTVAASSSSSSSDALALDIKKTRINKLYWRSDYSQIKMEAIVKDWEECTQLSAQCQDEAANNEGKIIKIADTRSGRKRPARLLVLLLNN